MTDENLDWLRFESSTAQYVGRNLGRCQEFGRGYSLPDSCRDARASQLRGSEFQIGTDRARLSSFMMTGHVDCLRRQAQSLPEVMYIATPCLVSWLCCNQGHS